MTGRGSYACTYMRTRSKHIEAERMSCNVVHADACTSTKLVNSVAGLQHLRHKAGREMSSETVAKAFFRINA